MDGLTLLSEARAAGLIVRLEGDRLKIRGPRRADPIARKLIAQKPAVLRVLQAEILPERGFSARSLPPDWYFLWEERAAIMEHDGGMRKEDADAAALIDIFRRMRK